MTKGIKAKDIRDFEKTVQKLDEVMKRIKSYNPHVCLFVASCGEFNLCVDAADTGDVQGDDVVTRLYVTNTDCGDWERFMLNHLYTLANYYSPIPQLETKNYDARLQFVYKYSGELVGNSA